MKGENAMASTNKTPRLGLSQWVLSDPFRMEDFNQDNARLDALAFEKIGEVVTTQDCQQVDLDVSQVEWSRYLAVGLLWQLVIKDNDTAAYSSIRVNNVADKYRYTSVDIGGAGGVNQTTLFSRQYRISDTYLRMPYYLTLLFPGVDRGTFYTKELSLSTANAHWFGGLTTTANGGFPMPLPDIKTLNFFAMKQTDPVSYQTLRAGSKFYLCGVTR